MEKARSLKVTQSMLQDLEDLFNAGAPPRVRLSTDQRTGKRRVISDEILIGATKSGEGAAAAKLYSDFSFTP